jgi:hypothetical protein
LGFGLHDVRRGAHIAASPAEHIDPGLDLSLDLFRRAEREQLLLVDRAPKREAIAELGLQRLGIVAGHVGL